MKLPTMGDYVPAYYPLPMNPVMSGMGDFVGASYPLPNNTVMAGLGGLSGCGMGCTGCGGRCNGYGMGDIQDSLPEFLKGDVTLPIVNTSVPKYLAYGGAAVLALMVLRSGGGRRR